MEASANALPMPPPASTAHAASPALGARSRSPLAHAASTSSDASASAARISVTPRAVARRIGAGRRTSVDDEELGTDRGGRTVRLGAVGHLVAHVGLQREAAAVGQLGVQLALGA